MNLNELKSLLIDQCVHVWRCTKTGNRKKRSIGALLALIAQGLVPSGANAAPSPSNTEAYSNLTTALSSSMLLPETIQQSTAPYQYTAQQLRALYDAAKRPGASLDARYTLQEGVYIGKKRGVDRTIIDGDPRTDTDLNYARAMMYLGGQHLLSPEQIALFNEDNERRQYQEAMNAACGAGNVSFVGALCFATAELTIKEYPGYRAKVGRNHYGTDIAMPVGTEIIMPHDGIVLSAGNAGGYGQEITVASTLNNTQTCSVLVGHVSKILVSEGQNVQAGQVIALSGNEGRSTGPHAHVEITCRDNNSHRLTAPNIRSMEKSGGLGAPRYMMNASYNDGRTGSYLAGIMNRSGTQLANLARPQQPAPVVFASNDFLAPVVSSAAPASVRVVFGGQATRPSLQNVSVWEELRSQGRTLRGPLRARREDTLPLGVMMPSAF